MYRKTRVVEYGLKWFGSVDKDENNFGSKVFPLEKSKTYPKCPKSNELEAGLQLGQTHTKSSRGN